MSWILGYVAGSAARNPEAAEKISAMSSWEFFVALLKGCIKYGIPAVLVCAIFLLILFVIFVGAVYLLHRLINK